MNATAKQQLRRNVLNEPYSNPVKTYSVPATTNEDGTLNIPAQAVFLVDPTKEPIPMIGTGVPSVSLDALANDSDKTVTVPVGERWKVTSIRTVLISTATVGNRQMQYVVTDPNGGVVWITTQFGTQAASLTISYLTFTGAAVLGGLNQTEAMPALDLRAGSTIRVWDANAVDAAADDMTVTIAYVASTP